MFLIVTWLTRAINVYMWMIVACIILSWFPEFQNNAFARSLSRLVNPYVSVFRNFIPTIGGFDFSVLVSVLVLQFASRGLWELVWILG